MKKALFLSYTALICSSLFTSPIYSQRSSVVAESVFVKNDRYPESPVAEISSKAIRSFNKEFKNVSNVNWFISSAGLSVAHFTHDNVETFVYYSARGTYEFMVRNYKEDKLAVEVLRLVKSNYYGFDIYHITEISRNNKIAYGVNLKNKTSWKTIKVLEGEIELITEYTESK